MAAIPAFRMARSNQPLIFVDTNVLLDFYRMREDSGIKLLRRLDSLHSEIITTYQVEMEFKRNRQRVIAEALNELKGCVRAISVPAFLAESKTNKALSTLRKKTEAKALKLRQRLLSFVANPSKDPVWRVVDSLFRNPNPTNLRRNDAARTEIKRNATMRFTLGYPPRKSSDTSMGDAFNWEWIVRCIEQEDRDVIIVSRDADYGITIENESFPNDWLVHEVKERTKKMRRIQLVDRLSKALKQIKIEVSSEEIRQENAVSAPARPVSPIPPASSIPQNPLDFLLQIDPDAEAQKAIAELLATLGVHSAGPNEKPKVAPVAWV